MTTILNDQTQTPKSISKRRLPALISLLSVSLGLAYATPAEAIEPGWSIQGAEFEPAITTERALSWVGIDGDDRFEGTIALADFTKNIFNFTATFADTAVPPFPVTLEFGIGKIGDETSPETSALSPVVQQAYTDWLNSEWQSLGKDGAWEIDAQNRLILVTIIDTDSDGIPDDEDACPDSIRGDTVIIGDIDSGIANTLFLDGDIRGCTVADLVQAISDGSDSHGQFVSTVAALANDLKKQGIISGKEKGKLVSAAAKSGS